MVQGTILYGSNMAAFKDLTSKSPKGASFDLLASSCECPRIFH